MNAYDARLERRMPVIGECTLDCDETTECPLSDLNEPFGSILICMLPHNIGCPHRWEKEDNERAFREGNI